MDRKVTVGRSTKASDQNYSIKTVDNDDYTILPTDKYDAIFVITGGAHRTVTLPPADVSSNREILIMKIDAGAGTVIIDGEDAETINGQTTRNLIYQYAKLTAVSDGTEWIIVESRRNLLHIRDEKAQNTNGGTFTQGAWRTRDLNTEKTNEITGASLVANQITLPAGIYYVEWSAPAHKVENHQTKLYNITNTADLIIGTSEKARTDDIALTRSFGNGRMTLTGTKVIELQHRCTDTINDIGFGLPCNFTTEVYSDIRIWQES